MVIYCVGCGEEVCPSDPTHIMDNWALGKGEGRGNELINTYCIEFLPHQTPLTKHIRYLVN